LAYFLVGHLALPMLYTYGVKHRGKLCEIGLFCVGWFVFAENILIFCDVWEGFAEKFLITY